MLKQKSLASIVVREIFFTWYYREAVVQRCSVKKVLSKISQNSQENTCARVSFLIKLQPMPTTLLKKRLLYKCFPANFVKFLRRPFPPNTLLAASHNPDFHPVSFAISYIVILY